jgi:hypothetical protein
VNAFVVDGDPNPVQPERMRCLSLATGVNAVQQSIDITAVYGPSTVGDTSAAMIPNRWLSESRHVGFRLE